MKDHIVFKLNTPKDDNTEALTLVATCDTWIDIIRSLNCAIEDKNLADTVYISVFAHRQKTGE